MATQKIKYIKVNLDNIDLAYNFQKKEWPNEPDYETFKNKSINGNERNINFIAYINDTPIGITGIYEEDIDPTSLWLDWFCVDKSFRGKGFGKQILLDTIEYCKQFDEINYFRIDTQLKKDRESTMLYLETMDFIEKYTIEDSEIINHGHYICTKCLKPNILFKPWNNRYLGLTEHYNNLKNINNTRRKNESK